ncbi:DUF2510 domain-containing protein [Actinoallomurus sp. NPDC052308]|uniref:DUF2510 domain-containing protein n=1 Tax=Actinoallomurus sp. NPDC052308 TaxID=3155530 RepID=UPI003432E8C1
MTPAGWYRDPFGDPGLLRWWDGYQWTQNTHPLGGDPQAPWDGASPAGPPPGTGEPAPQEGAEPGAGGPATRAWGDPGAGGPATQAWGDTAPPWGETGPGAPGAWPEAGPGAAPAWSETGPGAAPAWPGTGPGQAVPSAWPPPGPPAPESRNRLPLLIGGGAAVVIIITVVAVLFATNVFGGGNDKGGRSPVVATITDSQAGISYPRLGGGWRADTVTATGGLGRLGFDQGETATVMKNFQNGQPYVASAYSGVSTDTTSPSMEVKAKALFVALEPSAYPAHTHQILSSAAQSVGGHQGWLLKLRLTFPQAKSQGWNFRAETAAIMMVDRGNGQAPAEFYVSIPDSHKHQGDLDLLLTSLKVS